MRNIYIVMAVACLLVATLRSIGSRLAGTATAAISIIFAMVPVRHRSLHLVAREREHRTTSVFVSSAGVSSRGVQRNM